MFSSDCFLILLQLLYIVYTCIYDSDSTKMCQRNEMKFVYKFSINEIRIIKCIYCCFVRNN